MPTPEHLNVLPIAGTVTLIVPPVLRVPDGAVVPPQPYLLGAKDTATGELRHGVVGISIQSLINPSITEITVELVELANPDGTPAATRDEAYAVARAWDGEQPWPIGVPTVRNMYRVDGFELGEPRDTTIDPEQFMRDVGAVAEALGIELPATEVTQDRGDE